MKYSTPARNHQPMMSPLKLQNDLEFDNQQSLLINDSKISPSLVELKKPINSQDSSVMENLRKKIRNHAKKYEVSFTSKKINNVSIQLPNLTKRSIQDGFPLKDYRSVNGSTVVRGIHQKLNIIKEEMKRPCKNSSNAQKIRKREARTLPDRKDTESDSEYYSEEFSENDIYSTTYCGFDVAKEKEKLFKSGSKNYKEYCKEIEKSNVLPRKMGFQGKKEDKGNMFLKSFYIGNTYADPFSKGIKDLDTLQKINLSRCGLKDEGFIKIIKNAPDNLQELDISGNSNLGLKCYEELAKLLDKRENELTTLNLENNEAGNTAIKMLMEPLIYNDTLKCLNINKNGITDIGARYVTEMINLNNSISVLLMNWNKILSKGGISVCSAVESNKNIQVFDISFNNIGSKEDSKMANTLKKLFLNNKTLVHVDFSHCKFTTNELKIMNEGLKENHSILGIHMVGNKGKIDTLGFINPEDDSDIAITHIASRLSSELLTGKVKNKEKIKLSACSNCWICEGWTEVKFEFTPGISSQIPHDPDKPLYLHISADGYKEDLMLPDPEKSGTYSSLRMVPPGECTFYFSFDEKKVVADDLPNCVTTEVENFTVPKTNIIENIIQKNTLITKTYLTNMKCIPRPPPKFMVGRERLKTPWDFFKSVFRTYKPDDKKTLNGCFEIDWDNTKIGKVIKNGDELVAVKRYLKENYKAFRETYKYYSAVAPIGLICSIGTNTFSDIVSNCPGVINNENFKLSDLDLEFVATNAGLGRAKFNPDRQLVRHEFIEIFVRIAITKYYKNKLVETIPEAVGKLYEENLKDMFSRFDCHKWRKERLWNEACDLAFKRNLQSFNLIYKKNSGRYALPGATRFMSLDEFFDLICACGVVDDSFGQREISVLFNLAMMTQRNELDNDRHLNMIFVEFIEATARVADKLSLPPLIDEEEERDPTENLHANVSRRIKKKYPGLGLDYKIETLIYLMAKSCFKKIDMEVMEKSVLKYYDEKKSMPKTKKYGISSKLY